MSAGSRRAVPWLAFAAALVWAAGATASAPATVGPGEIARADSLFAAGRYDAADSLAARLLAALAGHPGLDSLDARLLDVRVRALTAAGRYNEPGARALAERAVELKRRAYGDDSPRVAQSLVNLGWLLYRAGDWRAAVPPVDRGLALATGAYGDAHNLSIRALHLRAALAEDDADFPLAEALYGREWHATRAVYGDSSAEAANTLNSMGILNRKWGRFPLARDQVERALALRELRLGARHFDVGVGHMNLGNVLMDLGDFAEARRHYQQAVEILEPFSGGRHPMRANALLGLGNAELMLGDSTGAMAAYRTGRGVVEASHGTDSPQAALLLVMEGQILAAHGDVDSALVELRRSLAIRTRVLGPAHPQTALSHFALGEAWRARGDHPRAIAEFDTAITTYRRAGLGDGIDASQALTSLARAQLASGRAAEAMATALATDSLVRAAIARHARALEDRLALEFSASQMRPLDVALSLLPGGGATLEPAWDALVRDRTQVLDEMALRRHLVATRSDPALRALADSLARSRAALARLAFRATAGRGRADADSAWLDARRHAERCEAALAEQSAGFRHDLGVQRAGLADVLARLRPGDALVSFVRFARDTGSMAAPEVYGAFACDGPGASGHWVALGPAAAIDAQIAVWRSEVARAPSPLARARDEASCRRAGERVRRAVWDPVAAAVPRARRVFVVPAGALHGVDFAALPVGAHEYLIERPVAIHRLTSERDLLAPADEAPANGLLALGGVDYDRGEPASAGGPVAAALPAEGAADGVFRGARSSCADLGRLRFGPLPGTREEVAELAARWTRAAGAGRADLRLGPEAGEAQLKHEAAGHRVLHIATHGFFVARACAAHPGDPPENPLLRSGLALAGANRRGQAAPGEEDGVLTAEEVGSLDLDGTQWVVLSACESGLGDAQDAEGVLGLQRAFRIAGARTVIMSLWPVGDQMTRHWMAALYDARLGTGASTADAVRRASLALLRERRASGLDTHPRTWAGFVAAGDWR